MAPSARTRRRSPPPSRRPRRGGGVVVLADLGSAVLATRAALDLLGPEWAARVRLSRGPLVEGAVIAAVQASIGDPLDAVVLAADAAAGLDKLAG